MALSNVFQIIVLIEFLTKMSNKFDFSWTTFSDKKEGEGLIARDKKRQGSLTEGKASVQLTSSSR